MELSMNQVGPVEPRAGNRVPWRLLALVAAGYAAGALVAFLLLEAFTAGPVLFPSAGVSVAALLLTARRNWVWVLGTVAVMETGVDLLYGQPLTVAWGFVLANTLEPLVSVVLVRRYVDALDLSRRRDLGVFVLCAVVGGPLVGGVVGGTTVAVGFGGPWVDAFLPFWAGDALGVLTVGGTVLAWSVDARRRQAGDVLEVVGLAALTVVVTAVAFWPLTVPLAYLPMPLLLWMAFVHGVSAVATAGLAMTLTANVMSAAGRGPWAALAATPEAEVATLQLFLATTILAAWLLAVEIRERERAAWLYEREHESAHQLQRALLPVVSGHLLGADIAATYRPADDQHEVGGDWYDVFALPDGRVAVVVGDIVGHDLHAAVAMGRLQPVLRVIAAAPHGGPGEVLESLDEACAHIPGSPFSTVGYAEYDIRDGLLRYACAGHPPPLLVADGESRYLEGGRSAPIGVTAGRRTDAAVTVAEGAILLWYSDGLIERRDADLDVGLGRLARVAASLDATAEPQTWCDTVMESLTADEHMEDDVVLVGLRLHRMAEAAEVGQDGTLPGRPLSAT